MVLGVNYIYDNYIYMYIERGNFIDIDMIVLDLFC